MQYSRHLAALVALAGIFAATPAWAGGTPVNRPAVIQAGKGQLVRVTAQTDATWLAKAQAAYPLKTCAVTGDELDSGAMGKPQDFIYRQAGKPDRLVRFCCADCTEDFAKAPAKYLKQIDDAAKKTPAR